MTPESAIVRITGDREGCRVQTPQVAARADGVWIRVENASGADRALYVRPGGEIALVLHAPPGRSETVITEPPGSWEVACVRPAAAPDADGWISLEVTDPEGFWVPAAPECAHSTWVQVDYFAEPSGRDGDPVDLAAEDLTHEIPGWATHDVVEPAGYPAAVPRLVRVVRHDEVIAVARYRVGTAGWYLDSYRYCERGGPTAGG